MRSSKLILATAVTAVVGQMTFSGTTARAATVTWDGGGANSNLNTPANFVGDVLPAIGDTVVFTGTVRLDPLVNVPTQYLGLTFDVNAGAFVFGGSSQLALGASPATAGPITNNSAQTQTFNGPVGTYGGVVTNSLATGALVFNSPFSIGFGGAASGNNVFFTGLGTTTLNAGVTGAGATATGGALVKQGAGTLIINAAAQGTFAPGNQIQGGILRVGADGALGSGNTLVTTGGGTLELYNNITFNHAVTNQGRASDALAHIRNFSGNNTLAAVTATTGGGFQNVESAAGNLTISNYIIASAVTTGRTFALSGAGNGTISAWSPAVATVAHNFTKAGAGTWTLGAGMASTGKINNVTVNGGTLVLDGGLGAIVSGNTLVANTGTLRIVAPDGTTGEPGNATPATTVTVQSGGTLDALTFTNYSLQVGQTLVGAGTIKTGGAFQAYGDNAIYVGNTAANGSIGTLAFQGNLSLSTLDASATAGIRFDLAATPTVGGGVNDLITVAGDLQVSTPSGAVKILVNPISGSLATGTYRLFDFTSGATLSPSSFAVSGVASGASRQSFSIGTAPGQVNLLVTGAAANLVWKGNVSNAWDVVTTQNFLNGATPDFFYQADNVTFNDTSANTTVNVTTALAPSAVTVNASQNYAFTGTGSITTANGLTKNGSGTLTIANTGANTFTGGVTINGGTLQVGVGGADGSLGTVPITNNGTLVVNSSVGSPTGVISGTGNVVVNGSGGLVFATANTYTGTTTLNAGQSIITNAAGLGDVAAGTTINAGAAIYSTVAQTIAEPLTVAGEGPAAGNGAIRSGGSAVTTFTGPVTLTASTTVNNDGASTAIFNAPITGTGDFVKVGGGTTILGADGNAWSGATVVNGGTLQIGAGAVASNLPAGPLTLATGTTVAFGSSQNVTFSRTVTGAAQIAQGTGGGTTTLTGDLTGFTGTLAVLPVAVQPGTVPTTIAGTLVVGVPTGATVARVQDSNGSNSSVLRLTNSAALAPGALIEVQAQQTTGTGRLELGNNISINAGTINISQRNIFAGLTVNDITPAILSTDGSNTLSGNIVAQTGGSYAGLGVSAGANFTVNGTVTPVSTAASPRGLLLQGAGTGTLNAVVSNNTQLINLVKIGSSTWTVTGANTYTGSNTILGGTLVFGTAAQTPVLGTGAQGIDIQGGKVAFKYTGNGAALAASVDAILTAGFGQTPKFATGTLRSTTLAAGRVLGFRDNADGSQVEVAYTLPGDTDLNFAVNFTDLLAVAQNYDPNGSNKTWSQGDFDYNDVVNFNDLLALAQNYNQSLSVAQQAILGSGFSGDYALALSLVPEPATLGLLGGVATLLIGRRRRA